MRQGRRIDHPVFIDPTFRAPESARCTECAHAREIAGQSRASPAFVIRHVVASTPLFTFRWFVNFRATRAHRRPTVRELC